MAAITPAVQGAIQGWQQIRQNEQDTQGKILQNIAAHRSLEFQDRRLAALDQTIATQSGVGQVAPSTGTYSGILDENNPLVVASNEAKRFVDMADSNVRVMAGSPRSEDYNSAMRIKKDADAEYRKTQNAINTESERRIGEIAQMGNAVHSDADLANFINAVRTNFGPGAALKILQQLPPGDQKFGLPKWDRTTEEALKPLIASQTKMADQLRQKTADENRALRESTAAQAHTDRVNAENDRNKRFMQAQGGVWSRFNTNQARLNENVGNTQTFREQSVINKDQASVNYYNYKDAAGAASNVLQKLNGPGGIDSVTTADAQNLAFKLSMVEQNFRYRQGGKYTLDQVKQLNGFWQNIGRKWETLGSGDKLLYHNEMKEAAQLIIDQYHEKNAISVQAGMKNIEAAAQRGVKAPQSLRAVGSLTDAIENGYAVPATDPKTKQRYIKFIDPTTGKPSGETTFRMFAPVAPSGEDTWAEEE